ncbi:bifunctional methylenetetrahydrofolate dehydrogenase/methenyltetrahydrofolate cyclohydrolase, partial [Burkholderia pseudomallei]
MLRCSATWRRTPASPTLPKRIPTMTATLIDGNALSKTLRAQAAERAAALAARG